MAALFEFCLKAAETPLGQRIHLISKLGVMRPLKTFVPPTSDPFKQTISCTQTPTYSYPLACGCAHYYHPTPHLHTPQRLNWLTVFALLIGCLLECLMPPVGLAGQTRTRRDKDWSSSKGCVTITVIRMQSMLEPKHRADIVLLSPGGRWEH